MVLIWSTDAQQSFRAIIRFYVQVSRKAAQSVADDILQTVEHLTVFAYLGNVVNNSSACTEMFRTLVTKNGLFKIVYYVDDSKNKIIVVFVHDCRQNPVTLAAKLDRFQQKILLTNKRKY
jgi:plasmid stabilization system protein ParE